MNTHLDEELDESFQGLESMDPPAQPQQHAPDAVPDERAPASGLKSMRIADVDQAMTERHPEWMGVPWDQIDPMLQEDAWDALRLWVDQLIDLQRLSDQIIPPCWFEHRRIVDELYMGLTLWEHVWAERSGPSMQPMIYWAEHLPGLIHRLREARSQLTCCPNDLEGWRHVPDRPMELSYDDGLWSRRRATVRELSSFDRDEKPSQQQLSDGKIAKVVTIAECSDAPSPQVRDLRPVVRGTGLSAACLEREHRRFSVGTAARISGPSCVSGPRDERARYGV